MVYRDNKVGLDNCLEAQFENKYRPKINEIVDLLEG